MVSVVFIPSTKFSPLARVLRNEIFLRSLPRHATACPTWTYGLIPIGHFGTIFSNSERLEKDGDATALKVHRPALKELPGYPILHQKRADAVYIQPTLESFNATWEKMTDNALKGLDWSNVFVAGGLVLGALLCPPIPLDHAEYPKSNHSEQWLSSDIDLYIYALGPNEANAKISHIEEVYRSNLPEALRSSMLIVRNSQTITFYSKWPRRRVQIVLKLIGSPREVLLNFDLDICAVGYDGTDVWLLPRCARALESAYSFTSSCSTPSQNHPSGFQRLHHGLDQRALSWRAQSYPRSAVSRFRLQLCFCFC